MTEAVSEEINCAFRKLEIKDEAKHLLPNIIDALALIPKGDVGTPPPGFRLKGKKACRSELDKISELSDKLVGVIGDLAQPSIVALADAGLLQVIHHKELVSMLKQVSAIAQRADVSKVSENQGAGRPKNNLAGGVANILASNYAKLTGKAPTVSTNNSGSQALPYGDFFDLVESVFKALGIDASPEAAARLGVKKFKERKQE